MFALEYGDQLGLDGKEGKTFQARVKTRVEGSCLAHDFTVRKGASVAVKTFKKTKSPARIQREAEFQQRCAKAGVSPHVFEVNRDKKYIVMEKLDSLPVDTYKGKALPEELQYQICALMNRMDEAGVLHADMNARNVMLNARGRPYMIDFGFGKDITNTVKKKFGQHPNVKVTLWGLIRGFKRNGITDCNIMNACLSSDQKHVYFTRGEELLTQVQHTRKRRRR